MAEQMNYKTLIHLLLRLSEDQILPDRSPDCDETNYALCSILNYLIPRNSFLDYLHLLQSPKGETLDLLQLESIHLFLFLLTSCSRYFLSSFVSSFAQSDIA